MSERIRGSYDDALYNSTYTLLYFQENVSVALLRPVHRSSPSICIDWMRPAAVAYDEYRRQ